MDPLANSYKGVPHGTTAQVKKDKCGPALKWYAEIRPWRPQGSFLAVASGEEVLLVPGHGGQEC